MLDRLLPRALYPLFVLIHPSFSLPPPPSLSHRFPLGLAFRLLLFLFRLDFFVREAPSPLSFLLDLARAPVSILGSVTRAFLLFLEPVCFRARESRRGRLRCHEWVLYALVMGEWGR